MAEQSVFALLYTVGLSLVYPINVWLWQENIKRGFAFGSRCFFPLSKYVYSPTVFIYRPGPFICFGLVLGLESSFGQLKAYFSAYEINRLCIVIHVVYGSRTLGFIGENIICT